MNNRDLAKLRYALLLYKLLVWKYLTPEHLSVLLGVALPNAYRYIRRLKDLGLVRSDRVLGYTLVSLTPEGREFTFDLFPEVEEFRDLYPSHTFKGEAPHNLTHELKVRKLCIRKLRPSVSYSVYAKVLGKVYGKDTIGLHRADAVYLHSEDGVIYPVAVEVELSPKKWAKIKAKLTKIAEAIGDIYSGVRFGFKRVSHAERFRTAVEKLPGYHARTIASHSNLFGHMNLKPVEIYREVEKDLKHLHKYGLFKEVRIDKNTAKELSRKLR